MFSQSKLNPPVPIETQGVELIDLAEDEEPKDGKPTESTKPSDGGETTKTIQPSETGENNKPPRSLETREAVETTKLSETNPSSEEPVTADPTDVSNQSGDTIEEAEGVGGTAEPPLSPTHSKHTVGHASQSVIFNTGMEAVTEAGTETGTGTGTESLTEADTEAGTGAETEAGTGTGTEEGTYPNKAAMEGVGYLLSRMAEEKIEAEEGPEVEDWSQAERGGFYQDFFDEQGAPGDFPPSAKKRKKNKKKKGGAAAQEPATIAPMTPEAFRQQQTAFWTSAGGGVEPWGGGFGSFREGYPGPPGPGYPPRGGYPGPPGGRFPCPPPGYNPGYYSTGYNPQEH